jgi:hypothetical protein
MVWVIDQILMKDAVYQLSKEYGFQLTEEDIEAITKQAEAGQRLIPETVCRRCRGCAAGALKIDPAEKP